MDIFMSCFEIIGTIAFAVSGAVVGLKKNMDIFGVCVLGVTTAAGGGIIRDLILGITPPAAFTDPEYVVVALVVSFAVFFSAIRNLLRMNHKIYDTLLMITDAAGLGVFTVYGVKVAMEAGFSQNSFLVVFVAVVTGVGGGVLRDMFAGDRPYIFVKHIYACAAIAGAVFCKFTWPYLGADLSMITGCAIIMIIRVCSAKFRWSLPKAKF